MYGRQIALALIALGVAVTAHAQTLGADPLTLVISPQYPAPYQTVTVTPQSTIVDLAQSSVTISVNGSTIASGSGAVNGTFSMGGPGSVDTITVSVSSPDGDYSTSATVSAATVALVEEPVSTTHPFYEGAPLVAIDGGVRLIAMSDLRASPSAAPIPSSDLVYTWKLGDQLLEDSSGLGKSTLSVKAPDQYRDEAVSVTVNSQDGTVTGSADIDITPVDPSILFYKDGPLIGPEFDTAITGTYAMQSDEESFLAVPYSFPGAPDFQWSVNGTPSVSDPVITLRPTGTGAGTAAVSADATVPNSYIGTTEQMTVSFGSGSSHSIFSL